MLPDGRLGVIDFGAVARLPGGHPEPIGRLTRLALRRRRRRGRSTGLRDEGFVKPTRRSTPRRCWTTSGRCWTRSRAEEFRFTRAWLRAEAAPAGQPEEPGLSAEPPAQPAAVLPADPPGDARLDRRALPAGGEGALPGDPRALAARLRGAEREPAPTRRSRAGAKAGIAQRVSRRAGLPIGRPALSADRISVGSADAPAPAGAHRDLTGGRRSLRVTDSLRPTHSRSGQCFVE